jgi:spore maturation protein CgeB
VLYPELIKRSIPLFTWDIEADCTPQIGEYFVKNCDFIFTTMEEKVQDFINRGYKSDTLLFGCNPEFHKPVASEDRFRHDLSLVARNYSNRYDYSKWFVLDILAKKKYDFMIYGIWWMDTKRPVNLSDYKENYWTEPGYDELPYEWLPIVVNSSKVIMGMNVPVNSNSHCSMRPFETMSCSDNSIMVAHYQKGQKNIFGDLMYHVNNTDEAEMAIDEILSMTDEQRKEKARIAREFVYTNHNYKLRAEKVIDVYNKNFGG